MSVIAHSLKPANRLLLLVGATGTLILVAAALAIPNLLRSRIGADESRRFPSAQHMYASTRLENMALNDSAPVSVPSAGPVAAVFKSAAPAAPKAPTTAGRQKSMNPGNAKSAAKFQVITSRRFV